MSRRPDPRQLWLIDPDEPERVTPELIAWLRATSDFSIRAEPGTWVPVAPRRKRRRKAQTSAPR